MSDIALLAKLAAMLESATSSVSVSAGRWMSAPMPAVPDALLPRRSGLSVELVRPPGRVRGWPRWQDVDRVDAHRHGLHPGNRTLRWRPHRQSHGAAELPARPGRSTPAGRPRRPSPQNSPPGTTPRPARRRRTPRRRPGHAPITKLTPARPPRTPRPEAKPRQQPRIDQRKRETKLLEENTRKERKRQKNKNREKDRKEKQQGENGDGAHPRRKRNAPTPETEGKRTKGRKTGKGKKRRQTSRKLNDRG